MSQENLISIYKINTENIFFNDCNNDFEKIIDSIINRGNEKNKTKREKRKDAKLKDYSFLEIKDIENYGFDIKLYHSKRIIPNSWNLFLSNVLSNNSDINLFNTNHDFIVFAYDNNNIFCFTGGIACNLVADICDENFPRELMIRMSNPEKIKQAKSRALTGAFYARELYFRGDYNISPTEAFGSVWKDVRASVRDEIRDDTDWQNILGEKTTRDLNCDVKNSFKIRKRVDFQTAVRLIKKLKDEFERNLTDEEKTSFYFLNTIRIIKNKDEKTNLNRNLTEIAFNYLKNSNPDVFDYDFCHKNYSDFLEADKYIAKRGKSEIGDWQEIENAQQVLDSLKDKIELTNIDDFEEDFTKKIKISSEHIEDPFLNTSDSIICHLHGELSVDNKTYFLIDKEWCFVEDGFLEILSKEFESYLNKDIYCKIPLNNWDNGGEGQYNESHLNKNNFLVGDRIILNGIELFDLLYLDGDSLYIIQVKDGLGASTRDACSQLRNSSKLIEESLKDTNNKKLKEFYHKLHNCNVNYTQNQNFKNQLQAIGTEIEFINKFKKSNRCYVLAFRYGKDKDDISKTQSNIAKFELLGLKDNIGLLDAEFKIFQISNQ